VRNIILDELVLNQVVAKTMRDILASEAELNSHALKEHGERASNGTTGTE
jgi:hypothetical protein